MSLFDNFSFFDMIHANLKCGTSDPMQFEHRAKVEDQDILMMIANHKDLAESIENRRQALIAAQEQYQIAEAEADLAIRRLFAIFRQKYPAIFNRKDFQGAAYKSNDDGYFVVSW